MHHANAEVAGTAAAAAMGVNERVGTMLVGVGPAGLGLLTAAYAAGELPALADLGMLVVDAEATPGGGNLLNYGVRSDSAATVFLECVEPLLEAAQLQQAPELRRISELPPFDSADLPLVGRLLQAAGKAIIDIARGYGVSVETCTRVTDVQPASAGGAVVTLTGPNGTRRVRADRLFLAPGGDPYVPEGYRASSAGRVCHSDVLLRRATFEEAYARLPAQPSILVLGRAHSAFSAADRLLADPRSTDWRSGAVTVAARGPVRVTYLSLEEAEADGVSPHPDDICPNTGRVFRLAGLRGDGARRYRLARERVDQRLTIGQLTDTQMLTAARHADLVIAATGFRSASLRLLPAGYAIDPDGSVLDPKGCRVPGVWSLGLGSGWRRSDGMGGEPSYTGPIDGVWHYQSVVAAALLSAAFPHRENKKAPVSVSAGRRPGGRCWVRTNVG